MGEDLKVHGRDIKEQAVQDVREAGLLDQWKEVGLKAHDTKPRVEDLTDPVKDTAKNLGEKVKEKSHEVKHDVKETA